MTSVVKVVDEWIKIDSHEIFTKTWKTSSTPIASLVLVHGFGEHVARYDRLFSYFASQGIECHGYDQRGWGETGKKSGQYGNNQGFDTALKDIDAAVNRQKIEGIPLVLMGHSMGGCLMLNYLGRGKIYGGVKKVSAAIASAPLVTLSMPIPAIKFHGLRFMANITPSLTIRAGLSADGISRDKEEVQKYIDDPLVHDYVTLATLKSFIDAGPEILKTYAKQITTPILLSHADTDPVNSYESAKQAYELFSSENKEIKNWPGLLHELHNETLPDRQAVSEYYLKYIQKYANATKN